MGRRKILTMEVAVAGRKRGERRERRQIVSILSRSLRRRKKTIQNLQREEENPKAGKRVLLLLSRKILQNHPCRLLSKSVNSGDSMMLIWNTMMRISKI